MHARRAVTNGVLAIWIFLSLCAPRSSTQAASPAVTAQHPNLSLQFTSGGHVLGFQSTGLYVASATHTLRADFVAANPVAPVASQAPSTGQGLQPLGSVTWADLWPGIDLTYAAVPGGIAQSTYQLAAGVDVADIQLAYSAPAHLGARGELLFDLANGQMSESAPKAWQWVDGQRRDLPVAFRVLESSAQASRVGFAVSGANPAYPLTIDPIMAWNKFFGDTSDENVADLVVDSAGNVYIVGASNRSWGTPINPFAGGSQDVYLAKLNSSGAFQWHTYLGGADSDYSNAIALDSGGNLYITGKSSAHWGTPVGTLTGTTFVARVDAESGARDWVTFLGSGTSDVGDDLCVTGNGATGSVFIVGESWKTWGAPVRSYSNVEDVFVAELNSVDGVLKGNTFLGGAGNDLSGGLSLFSSAGKLVVVGTSYSSWGTPVDAFSTSGSSGQHNGFVAELYSTANVEHAALELSWHTFFGSGQQSGWDVTHQSNGAIIATGPAGASWGTPVRAHSGDMDEAVVKFSNYGVMVWNTFLGGGGGSTQSGELISNNTVDLYVTGWSLHTWGTATSGDEGFVAKLNTETGELLWNKFFGDETTNTWVYTTAIATDSSNNVYLGGRAHSSFGISTPKESLYKGGEDAAVMKINSSGVIQWNTCVGDSDDDYGRDVAVDPAGNLFVIGDSTQTWGEPLQAFHGSRDVFVTKLDSNGEPIWMTFVGGASDDIGRSITIDAQGNLFIIGYSQASWGASPIRPYSLKNDVFVAELSPDGNVVWNTFLGGTYEDYASALQYATDGALYVTGTSDTTWGLPINAFSSGAKNAFAAKLSTTGALQWLTFLGGPSAVHGNDIALSGGSLYVAGVSYAGWCKPTCQRNYVGGQDGYVASLTTDGALQWVTFVGGSGDDTVNGLAAAPDGGLYLAGSSSAAWGAPSRTFAVGPDAFAGVLRPDGTLAMLTFLGGAGDDLGVDLTTDSSGRLYVLGSSTAAWGNPSTPYTAGIETFVAQVSPNGDLGASYFIGGLLTDRPGGVTFDSHSHAFVAGSSNDDWYAEEYYYPDGLQELSVDTTTGRYKGGWDGWVTQLDFTNCVYLPGLFR